MAELFDLKILASEHVFYDGKAQVLTIHTPEGSKQFLAHHLKSIYALTPGELKIRKEDGSDARIQNVPSCNGSCLSAFAV